MQGFVAKMATMAAMATMQPIWETGVILLMVTVAGALVLQLAVHKTLPAMLRQEHNVLGAAIFTVIGTTYAVLLAFMAMTAWEQYSAAETLARHEADAIGSIHLLSRGLPDPVGGLVRAETRAYVENVIGDEWPALIAGRILPADEPLLTQLSRTIVGVRPSAAQESNAQAELIKFVCDIATDRRGRRLVAHGTIPRSKTH